MYVIKNFLSQEEVNEVLNNLEGWKDGFTNSTKAHKDNQELINEKYAQLIAAKIQAHPYAKTRLFIKNMTLPRFNKYGKGQKYAKHIDAFKQFGVQTDWSYTLMLNPPKEGGELNIEIDGHSHSIALGAGDIVVYHSGNVHQVLPVVEGERVAAIGWIESLITRPDERAILTSMVEAMQRLDGQEEHKDTVLKLSFSYHNLLRLWSK